MTYKLGSKIYMAPEVYDHNYNEKCDLYSCGILLYFLVTKRIPRRDEKTGIYLMFDEKYP